MPTNTPTDLAGLDKHDPAGMAAFMRERARCSREFLKLTSEDQIRQFMESWQKNVLPHFAFRFEQGAELIERLVQERDDYKADSLRLLNDVQELTCGDPRKVCPNCRGALDVSAPHE